MPRGNVSTVDRLIQRLGKRALLNILKGTVKKTKRRKKTTKQEAR